MKSGKKLMWNGSKGGKMMLVVIIFLTKLILKMYEGNFVNILR